MAGHIVVLGVFVADLAFRADRMPKMGETVLGNAFALGPGGKGSNQSVAAARAGAETHFITRLGQDPFADMAFDIWKNAGVAPSVIQGDTPTGAAHIFIDDKTGDNAIVIYPGAAADLTPEDMQSQKKLIETSSVFMTQLEQPVGTAIEGLQLAKAGGATTILNPAPAAPLPDEIFSLCDYITPNESEAEALTGIPVTDVSSARAAADALREKGARNAVITLGASGVILVSDDGMTHQTAFTAGPVVETTGAGDAFNGGFAAGLAQDMSPGQALRFGCAVAGISVTRPGTAASMPTKTDIDAFLSAAP